MALGQDTRVGPYEIVGSLGRGSMGDVYLARDSRLNRNVAIKVISPETADESKRRRFTQEARAASALNHPNIVTVHDFGTEQGVSYIVSELVEGESLRDIIKKGPVPLKRLLAITVQIAEGLAAAHDAGIVHRDLKPENIMLTRDGRVKILDFGLAKPLLENGLEGATLEGETLDEGIAGTQPGLILGTVGYMSPEQTRGNPVGPQSDQFSLGVILHEMATGHQPFRGATPMETLIQIANLERPPFTPGPVAFRKLVERCLERDPEKRFASTREIVDRLNRIRQQLPEAQIRSMTDPDAGPAPAVRASERVTHRSAAHWWQRLSPRTVTVVLLGAALLGAATLLAFEYFNPSIGDPLTYSFTPIATESGLELFPEWSPNGRLLAYSAEKNGVMQVFTRSLKSDLLTQVTKSDADCYYPFWSADGTRLYYIAAPDGTPALWVVSATGSKPEVVARGVAQAAMSRDGKTLAMLRGNGAVYSLWIASPPSAEPKPAALKDAFLAWSTLRFAPDGRLGIWGSRPDGRSAFYVTSPDGSDASEYFANLGTSPFARNFSWMPDGKAIIYAERSGFWRNDHLWVGDLRSGRTRLVTNGTGREQWPDVAPNGREAAFASLDFRYEMADARLDGDGRLQSRQQNEFSETSPAWSPVGNEYAYATQRSGEPEIRLRNADSGWERRLVGAHDFDANTLMLLDVAFAPNGQSVAYTRAGGGGQEIWISATSGEPPVRLSHEPSHTAQQTPTWSPDGNWIAYTTIRDGAYVLEKARVGAGGKPEVVKQAAGADPQWSPRGDSIALIAPEGGVNLVAADGSSLRRLGSSRWLAIAWTKHGSRLLGVQRTSDGRLAFAWLDAATGSESRFADLGPYPAAFSYGSVSGMNPVRGLSIAPDSRTVTLSLLRMRSDLWLLQGLLARR